jgi:alpha-tubulin suppressor-like RCC1 family protein
VEGGGALHCWGTLMWPGSEDRSQWTLPTRLDTTAFRSVKQIVIGKNHALLLTGDGEVFGFGAGRWGKLGNGTTNDERYPAKLGFDLANVKVEQIAAGEDHSVILTRTPLLLLTCAVMMLMTLTTMMLLLVMVMMLMTTMMNND